MLIEGRIVLGLVEKVKVNGHEVLARIDTGAKKNSISKELVKKFGFGKPIKKMKIRTSTGKERRDVLEGELEIGGRKIKTLFNTANRSHMKYPVLIGREVLTQGFLIDPNKKQK